MRGRGRPRKIPKVEVPIHKASPRGRGKQRKRKASEDDADFVLDDVKKKAAKVGPSGQAAEHILTRTRASNKKTHFFDDEDAAAPDEARGKRGKISIKISKAQITSQKPERKSERKSKRKFDIQALNDEGDDDVYEEPVIEKPLKLKATTGETMLQLECYHEDLTSVQKILRQRLEQEYFDVLDKLQEKVKNGGRTMYESDRCKAYEIYQNNQTSILESCPSPEREKGKRGRKPRLGRPKAVHSTNNNSFPEAESSSNSQSMLDVLGLVRKTQDSCEGRNADENVLITSDLNPDGSPLFNDIILRIFALRMKDKEKNKDKDKDKEKENDKESSSVEDKVCGNDRTVEPSCPV